MRTSARSMSMLALSAFAACAGDESDIGILPIGAQAVPVTYLCASDINPWNFKQVGASFPNYFVVAIHGSLNNMFTTVRNPNKTEEALTPEQLATKMRPEWERDGKKPIMLLACKSGQGKAPQGLANELNVQVTAMTTNISFFSSDLWDELKELGIVGEWVNKGAATNGGHYLIGELPSGFTNYRELAYVKYYYRFMSGDWGELTSEEAYKRLQEDDFVQTKYREPVKTWLYKLGRGEILPKNIEVVYGKQRIFSPRKRLGGVCKAFFKK